MKSWLSKHKSSIGSVFAFLVIAPSVLYAQGAGVKAEVQHAAVAHVPRSLQVTVKNPDGLVNNSRRFNFNDECTAREGGRITRVSNVERRYTVYNKMSEWLLVRYADPAGQGLGSECANGTLFWMSVSDYDEAEAEYQKISASHEAEKEEIRRILRLGTNAPNK